MAEDGLLLNFAASNVPTVRPVRLKGGNWRDRRAAQRYAVNGPRSKRLYEELHLETKRSDAERTHEHEPEPKRPRLFQTSLKSRPSSKRPERQVISSLFSYNPQSVSTEEIVQDEVVLAASNAPLSDELETFTVLGLSSTIATHLTQKMNIKTPTAVQKAAVTHLLQHNEDTFIQAETGSGKTLAYLLPIVQRITALSSPKLPKLRGEDEAETSEKKVHRDSGLFAIILAPTRELARQIQTVLDTLLGCARWIVSGTVVGGEKKKSEKARLRKGLNILIATPGRLADHLSHTEALDVSSVRWLVLDEGDRLMELGFEDDIKKILGQLNLRLKASVAASAGHMEARLPERRSTVLCSATMKMDVERLGEITLKDAKHIQAQERVSSAETSNGIHFTAPAQLKQAYIVTPAKQRLVSLMAFLQQQFLRKGSVKKAMVFISCADSVNFHFETFGHRSSHTADDDADTALGQLSNLLVASDTTIADSAHLSSRDCPVKIFRLHGSLTQSLRTSTLKEYHDSEQASVLFCTDVASRGLDLPNVDLVIEYDPAFSREEHIHRIGRTARAGNDGRAVVFLMPGCEEGYVAVLGKDRLATAGSAPKRLLAEDLIKKSFKSPLGTVDGATLSRPGDAATNWEDAASEWQLDVERRALADQNFLELARKAYISHVRAYATHVVDERTYFDIKQLQLGHLAKAFGLRDRPGQMRVQGMGGRRGKTDEKSNIIKRRNETDAKGSVEHGKVDESVQEASRKMRKLVSNRKMMTGGGADEFNLG